MNCLQSVYPHKHTVTHIYIYTHAHLTHVYTHMHAHTHTHTIQKPTGNQPSKSKFTFPDKKLIFVALLFMLLRVWSIIVDISVYYLPMEATETYKHSYASAVLGVLEVCFLIVYYWPFVVCKILHCLILITQGHTMFTVY